ncbi:hypothetical protein BDV38DRAFT_237338 [Aspergillus pseudotamarii]|uniref:Uncharacterized protein n=1 Tax=Aspergillus pseudotamarii TaxID=132259 RepID=A0A5N6T5U0_ASPPS|nr:uncharacterized protein BDV38DRAFT_237338 [Aspergillus pseudotamarii]KAE8141683.1 hypothetical protein BDV38DRAFT_237338 [Aspergillus pseudotamarii]
MVIINTKLQVTLGKDFSSLYWVCFCYFSFHFSLSILVRVTQSSNIDRQRWGILLERVKQIYIVLPL